MPTREVADIRRRVAQVAEHLYGLDTDPQLSLVRGGGLRGDSAGVAAGVAPLVDGLWQRFPAVKDEADGLDDGGPVPTALTAAVAAMEADLAQVMAAAGRLAEGWRRLLPWVDAATTSLVGAEAEAGRLGVDDEPVLAEARRALERLQGDVAADPLAADATAASAALDEAVARVRELAALHRGLPAALEEAGRRVERLRALVAEGRERLHAARARVVDTSGLLEPLDPALVDGDERSLAPWLERLRAEAAGGGWRAAARGLDRWRVVADGLTGHAEAVVSANRAPVERRNQLRGLLDAYEAKAAAARVAERADVVALQREARAALLAAPADLDAGERAVMALGRAVASPVQP